MDNKTVTTIQKTITRLCERKQDYYPFLRKSQHEMGMPSVTVLSHMMDELMEILFPSYFGETNLPVERLEFHIGNKLFEVAELLRSEMVKGFCFECSDELIDQCINCYDRAEIIVAEFIDHLPEIKEKLNSDVYASYDGDPAARSYGEVIFCYPTIRCMIYQRVAHALHKMNAPLIPRILTEIAHLQTGIDIHPGAEIGKYFTIDHGTGVVIGETCIIGERVKIYQGVTLGAKSFPLDENGNPIKGIARHPIVGNNVVIYANATILGRITVGDNSVISANAWITRDVPPDTKVSS